MAVNLSPLPKFQFNQNGIPAAGAKLFTYAAGTMNKLGTSTDLTGGTPNSNPILLDANGQCDIWLTAGKSYKFILSPPTDTDPPTNAYWTEDNITGINDLVFKQSGTGAVSRTPQSIFLDTVSVKDYGAIGDGNSHPLSGAYANLAAAQVVYPFATSLSQEIDWCAWQAAVNYIQGLSYHPKLRAPYGLYIFSNALRISGNGLYIYGDGMGMCSDTGIVGSWSGGTGIKYTGSAMAAPPSTAQTGFVDCGIITMNWFGSGVTSRTNQIEDIAFFGQGNAIGVYAADNWHTNGASRRCLFNGCTWGVWAQDHAYGSAVEYCNFQGCTTGHLRLDNNCHKFKLRGCDFEGIDSGSGGTETPTNYLLIGSVGQSSAISVVDCNFDAYRVSDAVIRVKTACKGFSIWGGYLEIHDTATAGSVAIEAALGVSIGGGCRFTAPGGGTILYAIDLGASVNGSSITGCQFSGWTNPGAACLHLTNGAKNVFWMGNGISDGSTPWINENSFNGTGNFLYQEGTWTPALKFGGASTGITGTFTGEYTMLGDRCLYDARIVLTSKGSSTGAATITGFPFTSRNNIQQLVNIHATTGMSGLTGSLQAVIGSSSTIITLSQWSATGNSAIADTSFTDTAALNLGGQCRV